MKQLEASLISTSLTCGLLAAILYPIWSFAPLPDLINLLFHFAFGCLLIVAFSGIYFYLRRLTNSALFFFGCIFGVFAGLCFLLMTVIQSSNLTFIYDAIRKADNEQIKEEYYRILNGVFSVQLGIDICWDIMITVATILIGLALLKVNNWSERIFGLTGILIGTTVLVLNLYSFPIPPREDGLIDLGPINGVWYLFYFGWSTIRYIRSQKNK